MRVQVSLYDVSRGRITHHLDGWVNRPRGTAVRSFVEHSALLLAISEDEPLFRAYWDWARVTPEDSVKHWGKHLKPTRIRSIVSDIVRNYPFGARHVSDLEKFRSSSYAHMSALTHGAPLAVFRSAYTGDRGPDAVLRPSLGGRHSVPHRSLAEHVSWTVFEFFSFLLPLLHKRHGWRVPNASSKEDASDAHWTRDKWVLLRTLHIERRRPKRAKTARAPRGAPSRMTGSGGR